jgi:hypothetical protein
MCIQSIQDVVVEESEELESGNGCCEYLYLMHGLRGGNTIEREAGVLRG